MIMTSALGRRQSPISASGVGEQAAALAGISAGKAVRAVSIQRSRNGSGASASASARPTWPAPKSRTGVASSPKRSWNSPRTRVSLNSASPGN